MQYRNSIKNSRKRTLCPKGFTLIELLVVVATIGILAGMLLSVVAKAKPKAHSAICQNNLKQLQTGWLMYAHDNDDLLVPNKDDDDGTENWVSLPGSWVEGNAELDTSTTNVEKGALFPYHPNTTIYRCPADRSTLIDGSGRLRTRSYQLDGWLNGANKFASFPPYMTKYGSLKDPTRIFAFLDSGTCDSGSFYIIPFGYGYPGDSSEWINSPAERHGRGSNLSFADGHVEYRHWRWRKSTVYSNPVEGPDDLADLRWLQDLLPKE